MFTKSDESRTFIYFLTRSLKYIQKHKPFLKITEELLDYPHPIKIFALSSGPMTEEHVLVPKLGYDRFMQAFNFIGTYTAQDIFYAPAVGTSNQAHVFLYDGKDVYFADRSALHPDIQQILKDVLVYDLTVEELLLEKLF